MSILTEKSQNKLSKWLLFNVVVALLPIPADYLILSSSGMNPSLISILARGDILLISSAIAAGAIGDLIFAGDTFRNWKTVTIGLAVILLIVTTYYYAGLHLQNPNATRNESTIAFASSIFFLTTLIISSSCVVLAEV